MKLGRKILPALLFAFLLFGAWGTAWAANYREGEAIVVLKGMPSGGVRTHASLQISAVRVAESAASVAGARVATLHGYMTPASDKVFALIKSDNKTTGQLMDELKANPEVLAVSPNYIVRTLADPPNYKDGTQWGLAAIKAPAAWSVSLGSRDISVAVLDTGIAQAHPSFFENGIPNLDIGRSRNFTSTSTTDIDDTDGHGTHVSGIIGAVSGDVSESAVGVSPRVNLITLKLLSEGEGAADIIGALAHVSNLIINDGVDIKAINISVGWEYENKRNITDLLSEVGYLVFKEFELGLGEKAPVIVVSAGNDGIDIGTPFSGTLLNQQKRVSGYLPAPASYIGLKNMIVVGSIDKDFLASNHRSWGSNWSGEYVHLAAPGNEIYSTLPGNKYGSLSGTSMAAPFVSGSVALLASKNDQFKQATGVQLKRILLENTNAEHKNIGAPGRTTGYLSKYGLLDINAAINANVPDPESATAITLKAPSRVYSGVPFYIAAELTPWHATGEIIWTSDNHDVATVDINGFVTTHDKGGVTITASIGNISDSISLNVICPNETGGGSSGCDAGPTYAYLLLLLFAAGIYRAGRFAKRA